MIKIMEWVIDIGWPLVEWVVGNWRIIAIVMLCGIVYLFLKSVGYIG